MSEIRLVVKKGATLPSYQSRGAAGADCAAYLPEGDLIIPPGEARLVPTGLFLQIPDGYEVQVRPRSGLALKNAITVLNTPGTIDSDYRGEVGIILINHSKKDFIVHNGDRIAQLVFAPVVQAAFIPVDTLDESERGRGGFGSTGL